MRRGIFAKVAVLAAVIALLAAACGREEEQPQPGGTGGQQEEAQSTLDAVRERGTLRCGVNETVPGFGFLTAEGNIEGFDIDFCRAFAVAVFNDPEAEPELVPISADERFNALRAGQYDVLVRNTTWTSSRDGAEGVAFTHVNFYDSQAMMVRADSGFESLEDMNNTGICVTSGTTTELNLADVFGELGLEFEAVSFEENPQLQEAFIQDRCQGWTSDRSQLAGIRASWPEDQGGPDSLVILPDVMSKEPLTPAVLDGDSQWQDVVSWTIKGIILAEELGVDSGNVEQQAQNPDDPQIGNLLGAPTEEGAPFDPGLGVDPDFMVNVISAVGNYGEIYDRHVGASSPLGLERGLNALWSDDPPGLHYAPPYR
ncbi:MAG TPA: amino acid ABC transporter substrate-binding protein [Actinomycetota bacterium]|nr:amino acid ABC transporter substrate-binding protein [Actinomycetota bacterium]